MRTRSLKISGENFHEWFQIREIHESVIPRGTHAHTFTQNSRRKLSRMVPNPRNSRKCYPSKVSRYTVLDHNIVAHAAGMILCAMAIELHVQLWDRLQTLIDRVHKQARRRFRWPLETKRRGIHLGSDSTWPFDVHLRIHHHLQLLYNSPQATADQHD